MAAAAYVPPQDEVRPKSPNLAAPLLPPPVWDGKNDVVKDHDVDPILTSAAPYRPVPLLGRLTFVPELMSAALSVSVSLIDLLDLGLDGLQEHERHLREHVYLRGNYAPVSEEHESVPVPSESVVEGSIPPDLDGLFVQNGPNPIPEHVGGKRYHWFDGHGQLHNLRLRDGKALYSNFFVPTPRYLAERERGKELFLRFGELQGLVGLIKVALIHTARLALHGLDGLTVGQANTHCVVSDAGKFYACHEGSLPFEGAFLCSALPLCRLSFIAVAPFVFSLH